MKCTACGTENIEGAKFCASCGVELPIDRQMNAALRQTVELSKVNRSKKKKYQKKNSRLIYRSMMAFVAVTCLIILFETKEIRTDIYHAPTQARTYVVDSAVRVIATTEHKTEILSNFVCPCGKCKDELKDCVCTHPNGAKEVKAYVDERVAEGKYTAVQIIDKVAQKYGGRKT